MYIQPTNRTSKTLTHRPQPGVRKWLIYNQILLANKKNYSYPHVKSNVVCSQMFDGGALCITCRLYCFNRIFIGQTIIRTILGMYILLYSVSHKFIWETICFASAIRSGYKNKKICEIWKRNVSDYIDIDIVIGTLLSGYSC